MVNEKLDKEIRESCRRLIEYYCWHSMGNGDNYPSIWYLPAEVRYVVENDFTVDNSSKWYNVYYAIKYPTHRSVFYSSSEVATYATKLFLSDAIFSEKITKKEAFEIIRKMQHNENECYLKGNWETPYLMLRQPIKNRGRSQP
ncbi:MAG: hypothetical protein DWQ19_10185 [Crenarchaeota archaeon]|nr:MAG: hypothetical protein DWQ19_10185 [Thermoproteota archaeon]